MKMKKLISALCAGAMALSLMSVSAFASELPTATIKPLENSELLCGFTFEAPETLDAAYEDYKADFEISFNKDLAAGDIVLVGQYDAHGADPVVLDLDADYTVGDVIKVMDVFGWVPSYEYIVETVKTFNCGIAQGNEAADLSGLQATVALCLYNGDSKDVIATKTVDVLPSCNVAEIEADGALYALQFDAVDTDVEGKVYADWKADFEVSFNKDLAKDDITLVGQYDAYNDGALTTLSLKADYAAGDVIKVMDLYGWVPSYEYIVETVKTFKCGVVANKDLSDLAATINLCLYNGDKKYVVASKTLVAEELELPTATVEKIDNADLLAGFSFTADETNVDGKVYADWKADFEISFNKNLAAGDIKLVGQYDAHSANPVVLDLDADYTAGNVIKVMDVFGWVPSYEYIVETVKTFNCGVAANGKELDGVVATVALCLYDDAGNKYVIAEEEVALVSNWTYAQDAGYYDVEGAKSGLIRFLFGTNFGVEIAKVGVKFVDAAEIEKYFNSVEVTDYKGSFYGDITEIPETMSDKTFYALGYAEDVDGNVYWSDVQEATPNFTKLFK